MKLLSQECEKWLSHSKVMMAEEIALKKCRGNSPDIQKIVAHFYQTTFVFSGAIFDFYE